MHRIAALSVSLFYKYQLRRGFIAYCFSFCCNLEASSLKIRQLVVSVSVFSMAQVYGHVSGFCSSA